MKALLLVDLQNDFMPQGALGVAGGHEILPVINELIEMPFDVIVASCDSHPADHGSFAVTHGKKTGDKIMLEGLEQILWPVHCVQGTPGAAFAQGWKKEKIQKVFHKGTEKNIDSYSAFFDNGHRKATGLHDYLREKGITDLYLAGLTTEYCVTFSAFDALHLGYRVFVVIDGCRGVNLKPDDSDKAIKKMKDAGIHVIHLTDILPSEDISG